MQRWWLLGLVGFYPLLAEANLKWTPEFGPGAKL